MGKVNIVSHRADLDGVSSAVLASEVAYAKNGTPPDEVFFADYDDAREIIARAAIGADELWILDLSIKDPGLSAFFSHIPKSRVYFFDHHVSTRPTTQAWSDKATIFFDDTGSKCTADLVYANAKKIAPNFSKTKEMTQLVAATHSQDLWIRDVREGSLLSDCVAVLGANAVYRELLESPRSAFEENFPPKFQEAVVASDARRAASLDMARKTMVKNPVRGAQIGYALGLGYESETADAILGEGGVQYVVLFNILRGSASIRSRPEVVASVGIGCNEFASLFGGGGHPCAAGFSLFSDFGVTLMRGGVGSTHKVFANAFGV